MPYSEGTEEPLDFYLKVPWPYRLDISVGVLAVAVLLVVPWDGKYHPEGNWWFGPLWLLLDGRLGVKFAGAAIAAVMLVGIGSALFRPTLVTVLISFLTLHLWVGFGFILAIIATV